MDSAAKALCQELDAIRRAANAQVAEREGRPVQLELLAEEGQTWLPTD